MSKREKPKPSPQAQPFPPVPSPYCDGYRYTIDRDGVVTIWGSHGGTWHTGLSLPLSLAIDLHQKLGETIAGVIRRSAQVEQPSPQETQAPAKDA